MPANGSTYPRQSGAHLEVEGDQWSGQLGEAGPYITVSNARGCAATRRDGRKVFPGWPDSHILYRRIQNSDIVGLVFPYSSSTAASVALR